MKVRATNESYKHNIEIPEAKGIAIEGQEFEVTEARFIVLNGKNIYNLAFVEKVEETAEPIKEEVKETEVKEEKKKSVSKKKPSKKKI